MIRGGELSVWVGARMAAWAATGAFAGGQMRRGDLIEGGERAIYATLAMVVLASIGLLTALLTHDFSIKYVASYTSANLPKIYTITAFWGGQSGSLLFWAWTQALLTAFVLVRCRGRYRALLPVVMATLLGVEVFFLLVLTLVSNPFDRVPLAPEDGRGLHPLLLGDGTRIPQPLPLLG